MREKIKQLKQLIKENEIDLFFDVINNVLTKNSDLHDFVTTLESKYQHYKTDSIKGILTLNDRQLQRNQLTNDLLNLLNLADEDDFKSKVEKKSITFFHKSISEKQYELKQISNKKADGIEKAGYSLVKLSQIISAKKIDSDQSIPLDQTLKAASRKVLRRVTIGCTELKEVRAFQNKIFNEIIQVYHELVLYLDFPDETIDSHKIGLIEQNFNDIKTLVKNLENTLGAQTKLLNEMIIGVQHFIATKEPISTALKNQTSNNPTIQENINTTYSNFEAVDKILHKTLQSLNAIELSDIELIKQIKTLISELQLNLEEL